MRPILGLLHPASRCFCVILHEIDFCHAALYDDMSVAEIKNRAKESVSKDARGFSALTLIKSAHTQLSLGKNHESKSELKGALSAYIKAASLASMTMDSSEYKSERGKSGVVRKELQEFMEVRVTFPVSLDC